MKHLNIGLGFLLFSSIIYGSTLITAAIYSHVLMERSWNSNLGIFGSAMREVGRFPTIIAILLAIIGIVLVIKSIKK
ncbi:hypothetical protein [Salsuginibacillus kocurii]|uniref:hypothetical protein n=1 Tax=Salsuginibacillus kocurii TaxID=427078 RepID=UPI000378986D|nr:hypothetical protein [Salsuginibacillus kocurii]